MFTSSQKRLISTSADVPFAYASARVRMLEQRLLSQSDVERLVRAPTAGEAIRILASDTEYDAAASAMEGEDDYEGLLAAELKRVYDLVASFCPQPWLVQMWAARHGFHNLKAFLKAHLQGQPVDSGTLFPASPVDVDWLGEIAAAAVTKEEHPEPPSRRGRGHASPQQAAGSLYRQHLSRAARAAVAAYHQYSAPEEIDHVVDAAFQSYLLDLTEQHKAVPLRGWVVSFADLANLRSYVRAAVAGRTVESLARSWLGGGSVSGDRLTQAYTEGTEPQSRVEQLLALLSNTPYAEVVAEGWQAYQKHGLLHGLERGADHLLAGHIRQARQQPFGVAPVWGYLMAKEDEVRLLRFVLMGKSAGLSEAQLRERMAYV